MKLEKIRIHNIASVVESTIDFTKPPLSNSDVYLISGETGAGKSTILDSICLALFGTTPRLDKGANEAVADNTDNLTLKDPRRLMRRNTGEADIELNFVGNDGNHYLATWHVQRGKTKKPNNDLNIVERKVRNLDTPEEIQSTGKKDDELNKKVADIIGLDFSQFCRTTMLAQGEFTKFLSSTPKERAEILEKITDTEKFRKAGMLIFETIANKKAAFEEAQDEAKNTGLTTEEIQKKRDEIQQKKDTITENETHSDQALTKKNWLEKEKSLADEESSAQEKYKKASQDIDTEEFKANEKLVEQWNITGDARGWLGGMDKAGKEASQQQEKIGRQKQEFTRVLAGTTYLSQEKDNVDGRLAKAEEYFKAEEEKAPVYKNAQTIVARLDNYSAAKEAISGLISTITTEKDRLGSYVTKFNEADKEYTAAIEKQGETNKSLAEKQEELGNAHLNALRNEEKHISDLLGEIELAKTKLSHREDVKNKRKEELERLKGVLTSIKENKQKLKDIMSSWEAAKSEREATEKFLDLLKDTADNFAKSMRAKLTVGCTCPVCRQTVSNIPVEDLLEDEFKKAQTNFKTAKENFERIDGEKNKLGAEIKAYRKQYKGDKQRYDDDTSVGTAEKAAAEACKKCGFNNICTQEDLDTLKGTKTSYLNDTLKPKITAAELLEKEVNDLQGQSHNDAVDVPKKLTARNTAENNKTACEDRIKVAEKQQHDKEKELGELEEQLKQLITCDGWEHDWTEKPLEFQKEITNAADKYNGAKKEKNKLEGEQNTKGGTLGRINSTINNIYNLMPDWRGIVVEANELPELEQKATSVQSGLDAALNLLRKAQGEKENQSNLLDNFYAEHPEIDEARLRDICKYSANEMNRLSHDIQKQKQAPGEKKALLDKAKKNHTEHQETKPELTQEDTIDKLEESINGYKTRNESLNQEIGSILKTLDDDQKIKDGIGAKIQTMEAAKKEYDKWYRLNEFADKEGKKFSMIAQSYIFENLLNSANEYLKKLAPRYALKVVEGTLHSSLEDSCQGFATRNTSSLSGGESFLVSLALALALSDMGQGLSVDTLFIDEGFGSLSGRPLENAINMLRSLHNKSGRHVGIISHLDGVRDNIHVQIQVEPTTDGSSSTINVCETN